MNRSYFNLGIYLYVTKIKNNKNNGKKKSISN